MVALESGESLELDARGVSEVDVAGLQVLLAAKREAEARGTHSIVACKLV
jgi:ABC-type transporter Mla MlaB component